MKHTAHPKARSENLIVEELDGEVLVYDIDRDRAHCLNSTAALVWKLCNGRRTPSDIARELQRATQKPDTKNSRRALKASPAEGTAELVWLALDQLSRDHLLDKETFTTSRVPLISRREAIRRVGIGAAIAIPVVASITAPTAVQAGSCKPSGAACGTGAQCCSGTCTNNSCL
jgi:Coenzyme PQQ synthesis protein D (PqqD)